VPYELKELIFSYFTDVIIYNFLIIDLWQK
jgi:hypothetical protein